MALDLLLGTQRPRWSVTLPRDQLAANGAPAADAEELSRTTEAPASQAAAGLSVLAESISDLTAPSVPLAADSITSREIGLGRIGRLLVVGAILVLAGLLAVGLLRMSAGVRVWGPVLGAATACLLVGVLWMGRYGASQTELAKRPVTETEKEIELADAKLRQATDEVAGPRPEESRRKPAAGSGMGYRADRDQDDAAVPLKPSAGASEPAEPPRQEAADRYAGPGMGLGRAGGGAGMAASADAPAKPRPDAVAAGSLPSLGAVAKSEPTAPGPALAPAPMAAPQPSPVAAPASRPDSGAMSFVQPRAAPAAEANALPAEASPARRLGEKQKAGRSFGTAGAGGPIGQVEEREEAFERKRESLRERVATPSPPAPELRSAGEPLGTNRTKDVAGLLEREPGKTDQADQPAGGMGGMGGGKPSSARGGGGDPLAKKHLDAARPQAAEKAWDKRAVDEPSAEMPEPPADDGKPAVASGKAPGFDFLGRFTGPIYWQPGLGTDAQGRAVLHFSLPPNVTAYRVSIDAHGSGRIGHVQADFTTPPK